MRVVGLIDFVYGESNGGMQTVAQATAERLAARGHEYIFLAARGEGEASVEERGGVRVERFEPGTSKLGYLRASRKALASVAKRGRIDVVHSHFAYSALGPLSALGLKTPVVRTFHGAWNDESRIERGVTGDAAGTKRNARPRKSSGDYARDAIERIALARSQCVIALSPTARDVLSQQYGVDARLIELLPGGVNLDRFKPVADRGGVRYRLRLPRASTILMTACRLVQGKGVDVLLDATAALAELQPDVHCVIAGSGPEAGRLERLARARGIADRVHFVGVQRESLADYYNAADVFVNSSLMNETFGLVNVEALACGTPVVAMPSGAMPDILRPIDPRFVAAGKSAPELARSISIVIGGIADGTIDRGRLVDLMVRDYSWDRHAAGTERAFEHTLGK